MSVMETQYKGADVIVVSPDSDNLSVLQAALLGIDLRRHAELGLRPGEVSLFCSIPCSTLSSFCFG